MGKKSKVDIDGAPLQSITIGFVKKNKFGLLKVIILFSLFVGVIYYMPEIQALCNKYFPNNRFNTEKGNNIVNRPSGDNNSDNNDKSSDEKNDISDITFNELKFENIKYDSKKLTFALKNSSNEIVELNDVYFVLYNKGNIVKYIYIADSIEANQSIDFSFDVSVSADEFKVSKILENAYPEVSFVSDQLNCVNGFDTYTYKFSDGILQTVIHEATVSKNEGNFNEIYNDYLKLFRSLKGNDGVDASLKKNSDSMIYKVEIDYSIYSSDNERPYAYFSKDANAKSISFIMNSRLFSCS